MTTTRAGSKRLLRDLNQSIVLNLIAERGSISRIELARQSGLPAATITRIANEFLAAGLVTEVQAEESTGGRRPILLSINPSSGYVVGIKLREHNLTAAVCDLHSTVIHACNSDLRGETTPYKVVEIIAETVKRCISEAGVPFKRVLGVGVGMSGLVDSARGICRYSPRLQWRDVEIGPALEFQLRLPVRIDNDVNTLAVAARQFGAGRELQDFVLVAVGRGVGIGLVLRGEIYRGASGGAGEFGHTTVDSSADAPLCNCGKRGCLEAFISDYGQVRFYTGHDEGLQSSQDILRLVEQARHADDERLSAIFREAGSMLGIAIANLINIFDPARVLIERMPAAEFMIESMLKSIEERTFGPERTDIIQMVGVAEEIDWVRGAASLIIREVFQPPIYDNQENIVIDDLLAQGSPARSRRK